MRFFILAVLVAVLLAGPAKAGTIQAYGMGVGSCAKWVPIRELETVGYIFGVWTGLNAMMDRLGDNGLVGRNTDGDAIIAEVRLYCRQHPSLQLNRAIFETYFKIRAQEQ